MRFIVSAGAVLAAFAVSSCGQEVASPDQPVSAAAQIQETPDNGAILDAVLASDHRSDAERARDKYRHPKQTLLFLGIEPAMTVVEIWPGGGWYTNVLAPYLKNGGGVYYAAGFSPEGANERVSKALSEFRENYVGNTEIYGAVEMSVLGEGFDIAPEGTADAVVTFRNVHNWQRRDATDEYFAEFFRALKPGGVLGVVEHRADGNEDLTTDGSSGYVREAVVIAMAEGAGFEFVERSDINANAADSKDHPFGVWTLPPVRRSSAVRGQEDPEFDRARYNAIGESDRMTLKFRKPIAVDGALLE